MARKVLRRKLKGHDEAVVASSRILSCLSANFKIVAVVSLIVGILFVSYAGWLTYNKQSGKKAAEALYSVMKLHQAKADPSTGITPGALKNTDEKDREAAGKFTDISNTYKGRSVGTLALLYAANSYYDLKELDKAIELYNKLLFNNEREDPSLHGNMSEIKISPGIIRDAALDGLAHAYENKGDLKKAIEFQAALKDSHLREMSLLALGRLYEKSNDRTKATEAFQKIVSEFQESPIIPYAKERIEKLKGR